MATGTDQGDWETVTPGALVAKGASAPTDDDGWETVDASPRSPRNSEASLVQNRPRQVVPLPVPATLGRPAMPGVSSRYAGPQSVALTPQMRASREEMLTQPAKGISELAHGNIRLGVSDLIEGFGKLAFPLVAMTAPFEIGPTIAATVTGTAAQKGTEYLAPKLGASPETTRMLSDVAGAAGGVAGANLTPENVISAATGTKDAVVDTARGTKDWFGSKLREEPTVDTVSTRGNIDAPKRIATLKPGIKALASLGKVVGGPEVVNAIVPEHPTRIGPFSRLSNRVPVPEPELPGVPPTEPRVEDFYQNKAEDLVSRQKEQDAIDRKAARDERTASKSRVSIAGEGAADPRNTGSEGRPATWTNERVLALAAKGNRDAIAQAARRQLPMPENARYVMGDVDVPRVVLNPREVTRFTPEGTPIRNQANAAAQSPSSRARIQIIGENPPEENGKLLYHGTGAEAVNSAADLNATQAGEPGFRPQGTFLSSNPEAASGFAEKGGGRVVAGRLAPNAKIFNVEGGITPEREAELASQGYAGIRYKGAGNDEIVKLFPGREKDALIPDVPRKGVEIAGEAKGNGAVKIGGGNGSVVSEPNGSPQSIIESAGGVYWGKDEANGTIEIKLPPEMTKDLPIPDWQKRNISITMHEGDVTPENVKARIQAKYIQFGGKPK